MWDTKASERCLKRDTLEPTCHSCDTAVAPINHNNRPEYTCPPYNRKRDYQQDG